jgi:glucan biosynthesis protein C
MTERRLDYIDNIRILLTSVVILNHLSITYGAPGGWYYSEFEISKLKLIPMTALVMFAAFNQAYSMGFFFLLTGYFSAKSISKEKTQAFLFQRLLRLGIPILLFVYLISPLLRLSFRRIVYKIPINLKNLFSVYKQIRFGFELGPMWFIMLLLIFSIILVIFKNSIDRSSIQIAAPGRFSIIIAAVTIGLLTFMVRITFPIGTVFQPLNLQLPHVVQYIFMFFAGVFINLADWQDKLQSVSLKFWFPLTIVLMIILPILFFIVGGASGDVSSALGGYTWQSLVFSIWEQIFCVSMVAALLSLFYKFLNQNTGLTRELAASSYTTYIFHPLVLVIFTALLQELRYPPLLKITLLAIPTLVLCFFVASLLRRLPGLKSIL